MFGVCPIHPRVMVGQSCWCLHSPWLSLQQKLDGSWWWSCSVVEPLMLTWKVQFCRSSCITSHGCEVFRGIAEVCHWWHTRPTNLINTSQSTKYLVLDDCKSASQGRNKVSILTEPLAWTKGKIFGNTFFFFVAGEIWRRPSEYLLHLMLLSFRSNWGITSTI
jgi:hypothetical protein